MGYMSLRRYRNIKPSDSRLELQKLVKRLEDAFPRTEKLLEIADQPRQIISAVTGLRDVMKWDEDFERDKRDFTEMKRVAPVPAENFDALDLLQIESRLAVARKLESELAKLSSKYASNRIKNGDGIFRVPD